LAGGILGSKTGDFLTWVTIALVGMFLTLAVVMAKFYKPTISDFGAGQTQQLPAQQEQPISSELPESSEQPSPTDGIGSVTDNETLDANLLSD